MSALPARIGPAEFGELGRLVTVRCPADLAPLVRQAGGAWDPGGRRWLVERRVGPLVRALRKATDPLFRRVGIDLDEQAGGAAVVIQFESAATAAKQAAE